MSLSVNWIGREGMRKNGINIWPKKEISRWSRVRPRLLLDWEKTEAAPNTYRVNLSPVASRLVGKF